MKKRICVFTGARAEYGLLKPLLEEIRRDPELQLQLIVTGMHLSPEFGLTYKVIESEGFTADEKIEMILSSDTPSSICKSMGLGMIGFADALTRLNPDWVILLGDRFETMTAATTAMVLRIPIAHIQGGELTFGAIDDSMRHSITKMSLLHFTYTEEYRQRVIQLGEHPNRTFNVGGLNSEVIRGLPLLSRSDLEDQMGFKLGKQSALVTFHPVTLEKNTSARQFEAILDAFRALPDLQIIFTKTNADTEGRVINTLIDEFVIQNPNRSKAFISMGQLKYLSAMSQVDVVVGNSSSGIIETPSFQVPTVNIGDREKGRIRASNIIDTNTSATEILAGLQKALSVGFKKTLVDMKNPYDQANTAKNIKNTIKKFDTRDALKKEFFDLKTSAP